MARINNQAYKIRLPEKYYRIYNMVLISLLKLWTAPYNLKKTPLPDLKDNQEIYKPKSIKIYINTVKDYQYLVKWKGWPANYNI